MIKNLKLPRNNIELDRDWQVAPADSPHLMKWINKRLKLTAYCNVGDDLCNVFPNVPADVTLPDLTDYRNSLSTSHRHGMDITKYLSSIYLNPTNRDPRVLRRNMQDETNQFQYFDLF